MTVLGVDHGQLAAPLGCEPAARQFYGELLGLTELVAAQPITDRTSGS